MTNMTENAIQCHDTGDAYNVFLRLSSSWYTTKAILSITIKCWPTETESPIRVCILYLLFGRGLPEFLSKSISVK